MKWLLCALGLMVICVGCDTPYTGFLKAGDIDGYVKNAGKEIVCLADGFDSICIKTIPGPPGKDGKDGASIIGPRGEPGLQGEPGRDGAVVYLELEKIVTEIETVEVPVIEKEIFVLHVSRTEMTYHTPIGSVYIPESEPIEVPEGVTVTPVQTPDTPTQSPGVQPPANKLPTEQHPNAGDPNEIWHVMYRDDNGQASVFVYPRCFNNPYHSPPRPLCDSGISEAEFFEVSPAYDIEMQGTREDVQYLLDRALEEDNTTLGTVGGVQGVVN